MRTNDPFDGPFGPALDFEIECLSRLLADLKSVQRTGSPSGQDLAGAPCLRTGA